MTFEIWTIYVAAILAMMSTPGPSQLLMLSNSAAHGFRRALATTAGDLTANALQMLAAGLGLAALIAASATALSVIKWAGVAYLIWLGVRMIRRAKPDDPDLTSEKPAVSLRNLWMQGFLTSAANPKAVVFFAALFPQFISADAAFWPQFLILSVTYIVVDGMFLSTYGLSASWIAKRFKGNARVWIERAGGGFMILAAILLGLKTLTQR
ncbi:lysine transporter LysE [Actibacterium mucosum KCTC 23349]|uniref:Lysine transporter LysE n=1 Tax=Actibacterium mucosum KCTC 23349 TaxID=1454373 RepID=A0A037ZIM5_9RHOB|nr:LysE family translocator [Actibacterium mucosum]KAJ54690.1 lysine transporter LysE [Actibacterium mucosum KCTC 23349]